MNYNVDYFIEKFSAIPMDKWTIETYEDYKGCRCALGHCVESWGATTEESNCLATIIQDNLGSLVGNINDGFDGRYIQPDPKSRILAALYDIKEKSSNAI